jgi:predicted NAD/FAD-binding protein
MSLHANCGYRFRHLRHGGGASLEPQHEVTVYEAGAHIGGHTIPWTSSTSAAYAVDTGFIVYNDWTYPEFHRVDR